MTRLTTEWIKDLRTNVSAWNRKLKEKTGLDLVDVAARTSGKNPEEIRKAAKEMKVAVVPVTSGLGVIGSFAESVAAITETMGFASYVTEATDVDGMYEAYLKSADLLIMADDNRYLAINTKTGKIGDNNLGTAGAYIEILSQMAGDLSGEGVAVLGYGIIGRTMAARLTEKGAKVSVFDIDESLMPVIEKDGYGVISSAKELIQYRYLADGTCQGGWLDESQLKDDAKLVMPGVPLSLNDKSAEDMDDRFVHDLLEIGTAGMLGLAL